VGGTVSATDGQQAVSEAGKDGLSEDDGEAVDDSEPESESETVRRDAWCLTAEVTRLGTV
jgi:hypothetical protein